LRSAARTFCVVAFIIFSSEIFQGVFRIGVPDIDDFLMNLSGALIGFLVAKLFRFCEGMLS
ncbi:MAG: VanZ family protein, partial [Clostridia bacterium]|nr:VanZ family protein [Clostridia bacterium]